MTYLLDTNIVTAILKNNEIISQKLEEVRSQREKMFMSCITYYEMKRGLLAVNATRKISDFLVVCQEAKVLLLDGLEIIERASEIYADLKRKGRQIQDADILIAATAIAQGLILVSDDSDMLRVQGLTV
ncbi:MAG: type II toxin-antitoxin system VapC family toxin [Hormoscilla sp. SP5CHS1]|nr:type II toxin-antitoxin system VapC family toxin [Hormoscilla sp. SP12CHS1]MBC6454942.1 type II toxin-antitoxin system VapC family toxin [Hormoscilla sp. SP5CHS1]